MTEDGKPYGPERYKRIMQECYLISKNMNTSYADVLKISYREREGLIKNLLDEFNENKKVLEQQVQAIQEKSSSRK